MKKLTKKQLKAAYEDQQRYGIEGNRLDIPEDVAVIRNVKFALLPGIPVGLNKKDCINYAFDNYDKIKNRL